MLKFEDAPKTATTLSLNSKVLAMAEELGLDISRTVDALLTEEVKRVYWERWKTENQAAFQAYNERIAREGLPLAKYGTFARSVGDGRKKD